MSAHAAEGPEPALLSKTEQLVADVVAADAVLTWPDETDNGGVNWRQRADAAQRYCKVPDGKHLSVARNRDGFVVSLEHGAAGNAGERSPRPTPRSKRSAGVCGKLRRPAAANSASRMRARRRRT